MQHVGPAKWARVNDLVKMIVALRTAPHIDAGEF